MAYPFYIVDVFAEEPYAGNEVGRPSLVRPRARTVGPSREISVGGSVMVTVEGELL